MIIDVAYNNESALRLKNITDSSSNEKTRLIDHDIVIRLLMKMKILC